MKRKKVIDKKNLPIRFSIWPIVSLLTALKVFNAEAWMYWVSISIMFLAYSVGISSLKKEEEVDIFSAEESDTKKSIPWNEKKKILRESGKL